MSLKKPVTNLKKADGRSWVLYVRISTTLHFSHRYRNNLLGNGKLGSRKMRTSPKIPSCFVIVQPTEKFPTDIKKPHSKPCQKWWYLGCGKTISTAGRKFLLWWQREHHLVTRTVYVRVRGRFFSKMHEFRLSSWFSFKLESFSVIFLPCLFMIFVEIIVGSVG